MASDWVALAGFIRIKSRGFPGHWAGRQINIHLAAAGVSQLHVQRQALDAGVRLARRLYGPFRHARSRLGADHCQAAVPILAGDTEETLSARILRQEHRLYPLVVRWFAEGRIVVAEGESDPRDIPSVPPSSSPPEP